MFAVLQFYCHQALTLYTSPAQARANISFYSHSTHHTSSLNILILCSKSVRTVDLSIDIKPILCKNLEIYTIYYYDIGMVYIRYIHESN